jgi:hypothetical protein
MGAAIEVILLVEGYLLLAARSNRRRGIQAVAKREGEERALELSWAKRSECPGFERLK